MISIRGLEHRYSAKPAHRGPALHVAALQVAEWRVAQGERWAVLGPSGSGKSTLLHILAGLVRPSAGEVEVSGQDLAKLAGATLDRWRGATIGIVLQALHLVRHLSVRDNLRLAQYLAHLPQDDTR